MASLGLLGVPSSSAAHWPGQEKAPGALRAAGLTALLSETGHRVIDHGDRPVVRWRPHPHQRRGSLPSRRFGAADVAHDPSAAAREAISVVTASTDWFLVHFDVDVIDFFDLPVADVPQNNAGRTFAAAMAALTVLVGHPAFAGLIITEFNPDHGEPDGSTARTLATGLAAALCRRSS